MDRQENDTSSSHSPGNVLLHLKGIHFRLVTTTQRLKDELSRNFPVPLESNAVTFSGLAESVSALGSEFRATVERASPIERESVAVQKLLRDFQGVVRKAEALLREGRRKEQQAVKNLDEAAHGLGGAQDAGISVIEADRANTRNQIDRGRETQLQEQFAIDANDAIIRDREAAMTGISSQIGEVHQIFVDLAGLVNEQGGQVDDIESNIDRAKQRTENAVGQIRRAEKKGKKGRCNIFFVTGLAALAVLVLFIVMMA